MKLKEKPEDFIVVEVPNLTLTPKGTYLIFRLNKKEWNSEDVIQQISKKLNIPRKNISYSGSKDKQAMINRVRDLLWCALGMLILGFYGLDARKLIKKAFKK